jgi:hypothetical protein
VSNDEQVQAMTPTSSPTDAADDSIDWRAVARGSFVGLAIIVPVTVLRVILDREVTDFDESGWIYPLFVLILVGYFAAGWVAGRAQPTMPLTHGVLAGVGVLVLWIPVRILIWVVREDGRGLFSGEDAALRPGQVFGAFVIAAALAALGAWIGARALTRGERADA